MPPSWNLFLRELISHDFLNFWTLIWIFKSFNYCKILWKGSFIEFWTEKELKISTKIYKKKVFFVFKLWLRGKNRPSKSPSFAGRVSELNSLSNLDKSRATTSTNTPQTAKQSNQKLRRKRFFWFNDNFKREKAAINFFMVFIRFLDVINLSPAEVKK